MVPIEGRTHEMCGSKRDETIFGRPGCESLLVVSLFKCREFTVVGCECLLGWWLCVLGVVSWFCCNGFCPVFC
jgi:hypothetical protein